MTFKTVTGCVWLAMLDDFHSNAVFICDPVIGQNLVVLQITEWEDLCILKSC